MDCLSAEQLRQALAKPRGEPEREAIETHRKACAQCDTAVKALLERSDTAVTSQRDDAGQQLEEVSGDAFLRVLGEGPPPGAGSRARSADSGHAVMSRASAREPAGTPRPDIPGYEILGELGRGGMGVVYKAQQADLKRLVALKMILPERDGGPDDVVRFRKEAEALARLPHANVVQIYEFGEHDGRLYFAMEFVDGGSLKEKLDGTPLPARQAAQLLETLAWAVHHAHERGVIHRDLKPANILLASAGRQPPDDSEVSGGPRPLLAWDEYTPKVTDFGLAKRLDTQLGVMESGAIMGTPRYMAPEQAAGKNRDVGRATDVHALGAILYELLTGRPPFQASDMLETLEQVRFQEPVAPSRLQPKVPRDLETICLKCLQKEPGKRYASAGELAEDLARFLAGEPIRARATPFWERALKWAKRRPAVAALLVVIAGVAVCGPVIAVHERQLRQQANKAREWAEEKEAQALDLQEEVAGRYFELLLRFSEGGSHDEAIKIGEQTRALSAKLVQAYPNKIQYQITLASIYPTFRTISSQLCRHFAILLAPE